MTAGFCEFSDTAETDVTEIALYIAADSPAEALRFVTGLREHCRALAQNPSLYRLREEYGSGVRVALHGKYLVFYTEKGEGIVIERVLHGARHLDWVQL